MTSTFMRRMFSPFPGAGNRLGPLGGVRAGDPAC
jgi:hypothetical protein